MDKTFPKAWAYLNTIDSETSDQLDMYAKKLMLDEKAYDRASQALRRRFSRGAQTIEAIDRGGRTTRIKRDISGGSYIYSIEGSDMSWSTPDERIWVVAMYCLWQEHRLHKII